MSTLVNGGSAHRGRESRSVDPAGVSPVAKSARKSSASPRKTEGSAGIFSPPTGRADMSSETHDVLSIRPSTSHQSLFAAVQKVAPSDDQLESPSDSEDSKHSHLAAPIDLEACPSRDGTIVSSRASTPVPVEDVEPMPNATKRPLPGLMASFLCPICFDAPKYAVTTPCGHVFCGECLFQVVKRDAEKVAADARARQDSLRAMFNSVGGPAYAMLFHFAPAQRDLYLGSIRSHLQSRLVRESMQMYGLSALTVPREPASIAALGQTSRETALLMGNATPRTPQERAWVAHPSFNEARTYVQNEAATQEQYMDSLRQLISAGGPGGPAAPAAGPAGGGAGSALAARGTPGTPLSAPSPTTAARFNENGRRVVPAENIDPMVGTCPVCRTKIAGGFFGGFRKAAVQGLKFKYGKPADALDLLYGDGYTEQLQAWEKRNGLEAGDVVKADKAPRKQQAPAMSEKARGKKRAISPASASAPAANRSRTGSVSSVISVIEIDDSQAPAMPGGGDDEDAGDEADDGSGRPAQRRRLYTEVSDERIDLTGVTGLSSSEEEDAHGSAGGAGRHRQQHTDGAGLDGYEFYDDDEEDEGQEDGDVELAMPRMQQPQWMRASRMTSMGRTITGGSSEQDAITIDDD